jgi:hypothetical protein
MRLGEADSRLRERGEDPETFLLIYALGGSVGLKHPAWDSSWGRPTAQDVDDLEELGFIRNEPAGNAKRVFSLTVKGRQQAKMLTSTPRMDAGNAPPGPVILDWLLSVEADTPQVLREPEVLVETAVAAGLISVDSKQDFAAKLHQLVSEGYIAALVPQLDQVDPLQLLGLSEDLRLTVKAHDRAAPKTSGIAFYGSVVAGQIAAGDIANYAHFGALLDAAEKEIQGLHDVDEEAKAEARGLLNLLRGKASDLATAAVGGAGGQLLASVLSQLVGIPPPPTIGGP